MAWNAFYKDRYSLRESWCISKRCEDPEWDDEGEEEVEDVEKEEVGRSRSWRRVRKLTQH